jgi:predicted dehydrogenase
VTHSWQAPALDALAAPLRVGAIGCGAHARGVVWPELPGSGLVLRAICSRRLDSARLAARSFGVRHAFDDVEQMLDEIELDGLVIVVPPEAFGPLVRLAIERSLPAFVEKPAAADASEAAELADYAEQTGARIVVGYQKRFAAAYRRASMVIAEPEFGRPTLASFSWAMGPFLGRFNLREWLFENPVHHFDLARFFLGELSDVDVEAVDADGEFALLLNARSASGALVAIQANTMASWQQHNESVQIFGRGSSVFVDNVDTCVHRPAAAPESVWRPNYTVPARGNLSGETLGYGSELAHFHAVATGQIGSESDLRSAAETLKLANVIASAVSA